MPILVLGINHKTAELALREQVVFAAESLPLYLTDLLADGRVTEAVLLSTCNRSEIFCATDCADAVLAWFARQHGVAPALLEPAMYLHHDQAAVQHMMRVACGLDSMVLGEPQILGQLKTAFSEACAVGAVGTLFRRLFQQIFAVAKEVRTNTAIGACPVSMASTAVSLAKQAASDFSQAHVLLVGAGDTIKLVARQVKKETVKRLMIVARSREKAEELAAQCQASTATFEQLPIALAEADIVISATASAMPVITKAMLDSVMAARAQKPLIILDIAVPRDVEAAVADLANVTLYCIDDLKTQILQNLSGREHAAEKAEEMIVEKSHYFMRWLRSLNLATAIRTYRQQVEHICNLELTKAKRRLQQGMPAEQVLTSFSHAFTNKLLHSPSVQLRQAAFEGRTEVLQFAQELFDVPDTEATS